MSVAVPARRRAGSPARSRPAVERPATAAPPRRRSRPRTTRLRAGGVVWLVVVAALLGGIVAVQVEALRANIELGRLDDQAAQLRTSNQNAAADIAYLQNSARIDSFARRAGMVRVVPSAADVLTLGTPRHAAWPARHTGPVIQPRSSGRRAPR
jgi:cell division protein FtsL